MNDIHNMKLHELIRHQIEYKNGAFMINTLRVPNGWIYFSYKWSCFVPLSREFHKPQVSSNIEPASKDETKSG